MSNPIYVLLKEVQLWNNAKIVIVPIGTVIRVDVSDDTAYTTLGGLLISKVIVENNPEWFKLKEEPEVAKAEILITDFGTYNKRLDKYPDKVYCINVWNDIIPQDKFPAIKQAIENTLNEEKPTFDIDAINKRLMELKIEEFDKCKESPYYFATKHLTINGKPFTTLLSEEQFNKEFNSLKGTNEKKDTQEEKKGAFEVDKLLRNYGYVSPDQLLEAESKAFYAARDGMWVYNKGENEKRTLEFATYPTFTDYINSKK